MLEGLRLTVGRDMLDAERVDDWNGPRADGLGPIWPMEALTFARLVIGVPSTFVTVVGHLMFDADTLSLADCPGSILVWVLEAEGMGGGTWLGRPDKAEARLDG